jgi:cation:H+ antiporter
MCGLAPYRQSPLVVLIPVSAVIFGFILLVWGADRLVMGSAATARNLGVSPLLIGLTIVGLGTSAPEILVSVIAASEGNPGLAIGNALGSNITNVALVLGITAMITPLAIQSAVIRREMPILIFIMVVNLILMWDQLLSRIDGSILLVGLVLMVGSLIHLGMRSRSTDPIIAEFDAEIRGDLTFAQSVSWTLFGMAVLLVGARILVLGAVDLAVAFGVSDLVIGLTIVALGTSLPELAASVVGALKGEHDIAVGNIIGSNMFNLLAVIGFAATIHPLELDPAVLERDFPMMAALTLLLAAMGYEFEGHGRINRIQGGALLFAYFGYLTTLYFGILR